MLSFSSGLEDEIQNHIRQALSSFGQLSGHVFLNRDLTTTTKVAVYTTVCISTLLYGCDAWTMYRAHVHILKSYHICCLQCILDLTLADHILHDTILQSTSCLSIETLLIHRLFRWWIM